jgi:hypothetical protein
MVPVDQCEPHKLARRVHDHIVSRAELVSVLEPLSVYGRPDEFTGVVTQAFVEEFVGAEDGQVIH